MHYKKFLLRNYSKMTKVVSSIFGEDDQVKVFKVYNRINNNFVMYINAYEDEQILISNITTKI